MDEADIIRIAQDIRDDLESDPAEGAQLDSTPWDHLFSAFGAGTLSARIQILTDWALSDSDPIEPEVRERLLQRADRGSRAGRRLTEIFHKTVQDAKLIRSGQQNAVNAETRLSVESLSRIADDLHVFPEDLLESARLVLEELTSAIALLRSDQEPNS